MALTNNDQTIIRDYLLGKLSDDEQQKIEERLMLEDELSEELEISKGEIVEEYCANELSRDEQQWLERNFLASPEGKERYELAITLSHKRERPAPEPPRSRTFSQWLSDLFKQRSWLITTATAAAAIVIVAAVFLQPGQTVVGPTLASSFINRERGILPARVTIPSNAGKLKIRLLLPSDFSPGAKYRAELDNKTEVKAVEVQEFDREGVWVVIPVKQLPRGEYSLKLVSISSGGAEREIPGDYLFNVE